MLEGLLVDLVPYNKPFRDWGYEWNNNESSFWSSGGDRRFISLAQHEFGMQQWWEAKERSRMKGVFGVQTKDGKPIGFFGLNWVVPHHRLAMLGAKIGEPEYWSGGYGTDALLLLVDYASDWLDFHKLWLMTSSMNARVQRQMEKVGFKLEARRRDGEYADGMWYDGLTYSLLCEEWPGRAVLIDKLGLQAR